MINLEDTWDEELKELATAATEAEVMGKLLVLHAKNLKSICESLMSIRKRKKRGLENKKQFGEDNLD